MIEKGYSLGGNDKDRLVCNYQDEWWGCNETSIVAWWTHPIPHVIKHTFIKEPPDDVRPITMVGFCEKHKDCAPDPELYVEGVIFTRISEEQAIALTINHLGITREEYDVRSVMES